MPDPAAAIYQFKAALAAAGLVIVPREPTKEMVEVFVSTAGPAKEWGYRIKERVWRAMIDAAPQVSDDLY